MKIHRGDCDGASWREKYEQEVRKRRAAEDVINEMRIRMYELYEVINWYQAKYPRSRG